MQTVGVVAVEVAEEDEIEVAGADAPLLQLLVDGLPLRQDGPVDAALLAQVGEPSGAAPVDAAPPGVDENQTVRPLDEVARHGGRHQVLGPAQQVGPGQRPVGVTMVGQCLVDDDRARVQDSESRIKSRTGHGKTVLAPRSADEPGPVTALASPRIRRRREHAARRWRPARRPPRRPRCRRRRHRRPLGRRARWSGR